MPIDGPRGAMVVTFRRVAVSLYCATFGPGFAAPAAAAAVDFNRDVRPILATHCFACHGRDENQREAELRLDQREGAVASAALVPGKPQPSKLVKRIESKDPDFQMPPPDSGHVLTAAEIQTLRQWIADGAEYQAHWSFVPPRKEPLPATAASDWPRSPMDHFVLAKLQAKQMKPSPDADRALWLRRVSLDLCGLPPTLDEAEAFLADRSPDAHEKVVDRLLKSTAYGEHWARMWLDLARYADTKGYEKDRHRDIWRYRDWVIDALNRDMPFDQFSTEQLAGDLIADRTTEQILATAFHRNTMTNDEGGTDNEEFRVAAVKDRVDTTIQVWMGLTMGCAKCHTHKYDPISINDYYAFYAVFNQTQDADNEAPFWQTPTAAQMRKLEQLAAHIKELEEKSKQRPEGFVQQFDDWRQQFDTRPLWTPLQLVEFDSKQGVKLTQDDKDRLIASGERPQADTWTLTLELPAAEEGETFTSLRIDHFPQAEAGGDWPDANVALREVSVEWLDAAGKAEKLKLVKPRATYSQPGWSVEKAIDGNANVGWALSPKFKQRQAACFDFARPVGSGRLRVTLEQQHGQGLLLARSRFSTSRYPSSWLPAELEPDLERIFATEVFAETRETLQALKKARSDHSQLSASVPKTPVMLELDAKKQRPTHLHTRGNFLDPGESVTQAVLAEFGPLPDGAEANRLGVAQWLFQPENPLTARVMVNRVWARLFGVGLVETEEDFGTQGRSPSHPALLDRLAVDFREQGWSLKQLIREIVLSRTYRQSSTATKDQLAQDPQNRWLGRGPRYRLSAETVRDQALAVSGLLTRKLGGPSVMPPQPGGVWKSTYSGQDWENDEGPDRYRRGLYTYLKRTSPYPAMVTFDAGSGEVCQIRRVRTNTPLQALVTLNDTAFIEAAGALAERMEQAGDALRTQIAHGFQRVLIRKPEAKELERLVALYESLGDDLENGDALLKSAGRDKGDPRLVVIANVLLNLDETLMKP